MTQLPPPPFSGPAGQLGYLDLTVQGSRWTSSPIPPEVYVNGHALVSGYGRRQVPVPAGPARVDAVCRWTKTYGEATLVTTVAPGQTVPVFYAAPTHVFGAGSIGHVRQRPRGVWLIWGVVAVVMLAIAVPIVWGVLSA